MSPLASHAPVRRAWLLLAAWSAFACGESGGGAAPKPPTSRFEAVSAKAPAGDGLAGFCDVRAEPGQGKPFTLPALEGTAPPASDKPQWINLWATWCKPCVEEMPMIGSWQKQLAGENKPIVVGFVSVDEKAEQVETFRAQHPNLPPSARLQDPASLGPLVAALGLDSGAGLPIHVFVEPGNHVRCVRAGAITESHYAIVSGMF